MLFARYRLKIGDSYEVQGVELWAAQRWAARRYLQMTGMDQPLWYRRRRSRRLRGVPTVPWSLGRSS